MWNLEVIKPCKINQDHDDATNSGWMSDPMLEDCYQITLLPGPPTWFLSVLESSPFFKLSSLPVYGTENKILFFIFIHIKVSSASLLHNNSLHIYAVFTYL